MLLFLLLLFHLFLWFDSCFYLLILYTYTQKFVVSNDLPYVVAFNSSLNLPYFKHHDHQHDQHHHHHNNNNKNMNIKYIHHEGTNYKHQYLIILFNSFIPICDYMLPICWFLFRSKIQEKNHRKIAFNIKEKSIIVILLYGTCTQHY